MISVPGLHSASIADPSNWQLESVGQVNSATIGMRRERIGRKLAEERRLLPASLLEDPP